MGELDNEDDQLRKIVAIKCAQALKQRRIRGLLDKYLKQEHYYYNSLHWLDLGASMPRHLVKNVTEAELAKFN